MTPTAVETKTIGRYTVIEAIKGGGKSQCVRAYAPDGTVVFLKRFLAPAYPVDDGADSARSRKLRALGDAFQRRHEEIMELLESTTHGGGNLVKPLEFLRHGGSYFKAYPFLEAEPSTAMASAKPKDRAVFLKTLLLSVRELHAVHVVHADLKPDNVMVKRMPAGTIAKLIDFDEAYVAGRPPTVRFISGDPVYCSPELERYSEGGAEPGEMTLASDIFSLGLVIHRLLAGSLPEFVGGAGDSCARRIMSGATVRFESMSDLPADFEHLLPHTVALDPAERPTIDDLAAAVGLPKLPGTMPNPRPAPEADTGRLVIHMGRRK